MMRKHRGQAGRRIAALLLAIAAAIAAQAWSGAQVVHPKAGEVVPSFEVATVKPNVSGGHREHVWINDNSYRIENLTLRQIIRNAYGVQSDAQLKHGIGSGPGRAVRSQCEGRRQRLRANEKTTA